MHFSRGTSRHVKVRDSKGPSQGVFQHSDPHERRPYAPKIEDRSQEETLKQERSARRDEAQRQGQSHIILALGSLVSSTSAIFERLRGRFPSLNAHAGQERSELS